MGSKPRCGPFFKRGLCAFKCSGLKNKRAEGVVVGGRPVRFTTANMAAGWKQQFPLLFSENVLHQSGFFFPDKVLIKDANEARYTNPRADG